MCDIDAVYAMQYDHFNYSVKYQLRVASVPCTMSSQIPIVSCIILALSSCELATYIT